MMYELRYEECEGRLDVRWWATPHGRVKEMTLQCAVEDAPAWVVVMRHAAALAGDLLNYTDPPPKVVFYATINEEMEVVRLGLLTGAQLTLDLVCSDDATGSEPEKMHERSDR